MPAQLGKGIRRETIGVHILDGSLSEVIPIQHNRLEKEVRSDSCNEAVILRPVNAEGPKLMATVDNAIA